MRYLTFVLAMMSALPLAAQDAPRALPAFSVIDADGRAVGSHSFAQQGRTLVVYIKADCRACDQLLGAISRVGSDSLAPRLVLLIGAPVEGAATIAERAVPQGLRGATWYADREGDAWTALGLTGLPVMMGVDGETIAWTLRGAQDRRLLESVVRTWIGATEGQDR
jgi:hypothetical protein